MKKGLFINRVLESGYPTRTGATRYIYIYIGVVKHAPIKFRSVFSGLKYVENVLYGSFSKIMQAFCMYILHLHRELSMEY